MKPERAKPFFVDIVPRDNWNEVGGVLLVTTIRAVKLEPDEAGGFM